MSTNISLTPELELYAKSQVASGLYNSVSEFMREAVRLHREKNIEHALYLQAMHKELSLAETEIDQGQLSSFNMQEITERAFNEMDSENAK
ncbi:MAG: type II toxin-antitoxin system ParD family antitoxin [Gammaproteobacteria bacterium]|nr:type II toxin-antitoxin system ParD family antitoxin [Gammaproteobacteria bacterium]